MADNTELDPGTGGDVIATDEVASLSAKVQYVKLMNGTADAADRIAGDATNGLDVDVTRVQGTVTVGDGGSTLSVDDGGASLTVDNAALSVTGGGAEATALRVTLANDSTGVVSVDDNGASLTVDGSVSLAAALPAGTNNIGDVDVLTLPNVTNGGTFAVQESGSALTALQLIDNTIVADDAAFTVATTSVNMAGFLADQASTDSVNEGDAGAARMTLDRKQIVTVAPSADTEGLTIFRTLDADETEEEIKATAGKLYGWYLYNDGAAEVYVKFYNATAANVTVGTTTPVLTIPVPAGAAANVEFTNGITFSTAICIAATTAVADNDTAAPAANQVIANVFYQ